MHRIGFWSLSPLKACISSTASISQSVVKSTESEGQDISGFNGVFGEKIPFFTEMTADANPAISPSKVE